MIVADQAPVENWDADNAAVAVAAEDPIVAPAGVFLHSVPVGQQDCVIRVDFGAQFRAGFLSRRAVGVVHARHGQSGAVAGPQFILVAEHTYAVLAQQFRAEKTEGNLNNEIGLPLTLMRMTKDTEVMVAEMGMNHFGELSRMTAAAQPDYAVITNIGTSHIEFLGSREGICKAKLEILEGLREGGTAVLCGDEPLLWDKRDSLGCKVCTYGVENEACDLVAQLREDGSFTLKNNGLESETLPIGESFTARLAIPGAHNVLNALAAASVGLLMGETVENIVRGLSSYTASGMRQNIYEQNGFRIYADCYNASPDAMEATLRVLGTLGEGGRRIAVLGSMLELGDYTEEGHRRAGRAAAEFADALYAYGPSADAIVRGAKEKGMTAVHAFDDQNELVRALRADAKPGDALLFKGSRGMRMERALALFMGEEVE